jgi:NADH:ubiquinone oxidoreductase subunit
MSLLERMVRFATWWNGATFGTRRFTKRHGQKVGDDAFGNVYYTGGTDVLGRPRRWVIYHGSNDSSRVPPDWYVWLHGMVDETPDKALPAPREWQKDWIPNLTGTNAAYRPAGALEAGGKRAAATGDYEAWSPDAA